MGYPYISVTKILWYRGGLLRDAVRQVSHLYNSCKNDLVMWRPALKYPYSRCDKEAR